METETTTAFREKSLNLGDDMLTTKKGVDNNIDQDLNGHHEKKDLRLEKLVTTSFVRNYNINCYYLKLKIKEEEEYDENGDLIKCSAVHTLERDMPDFDYSNLVDDLRNRVFELHEKCPGLFDDKDIKKCKQDEWQIARFLLRNKLQVDDAFEMMTKALRYRHESLNNSLRMTDFPAEFYQIGGLFPYECDRKGNLMLYMRVKIHRKVPELQAVLQSYIYRMLSNIDDAANGRGIGVIIDCQGGGLVNADMETLLFFINLLRNYFPKGLSYILVHELPWLLKPFWYIARQWIPDEHAQLIKFSDSQTVYEYINRDHLPDFMGGTCKRSYTSAPPDCTTLFEACKIWGLKPESVVKIIKRYGEHLPEGALEKFLEQMEACNNNSS